VSEIISRIILVYWNSVL